MFLAEEDVLDDDIVIRRFRELYECVNYSFHRNFFSVQMVEEAGIVQLEKDSCIVEQDIFKKAIIISSKRDRSSRFFYIKSL